MGKKKSACSVRNDGWLLWADEGSGVRSNWGAVVLHPLQLSYVEWVAGTNGSPSAATSFMSVRTFVDASVLASAAASRLALPLLGEPPRQ